MSACPWCAQPEGHTGVCGATQPKRDASVVGRPLVIRVANGLVGLLALTDGPGLRVWWLRGGRWDLEQSVLEPLWQVEMQATQGHITVGLTATLGKTRIVHEGIKLHPKDVAALLAKHPSPTDVGRIVREEYGGDVEGAAQDSTWAQKVRGTRPW